MIIETGAGVANSNSYVSVEEGDSYYTSHLYGVLWQAATTSRKESALITATRLIDALGSWFGSLSSPNQSLEFPRKNLVLSDGTVFPDNTIPYKVKQAVLEMCRFTLEKDREADGEQSVVKEKIDVIEVEYGNYRIQLVPESIQKMVASFRLTSSTNSYDSSAAASFTRSRA